MSDNAADERRSARSNVVLAAMLEADGRHFRVRISNVSAHGALVTGEALPAEGDQVILRCKGRTIPGWVAWTGRSHSGIQFEEEVQLRDLLNDVSRYSQMIVRDERKLDFRRPGFRGNQLTDEERQAVEEWKRG